VFSYICLSLKPLFERKCIVNDNFFKNTIEKTSRLPLLITIVASYYGGIYVQLQFAFMHSNTFNLKS